MAEVKTRILVGPVFSRNDCRRVCRGPLLCRDLLSRAADVTPTLFRHKRALTVLVPHNSRLSTPPALDPSTAEALFRDSDPRQRAETIARMTSAVIRDRAVPAASPVKCRRVATRYDKLAANYFAFIQLASIRLWLRVL
jgi:hypothetical protein